MAHRIRKITRLVLAAGGTVEKRDGSHLYVTGPAGTARIGTEIDGRSWPNTRAVILRYAGIRVVGSP